MKLVHFLLDLLYPPNCLFCGSCSDGAFLCPACGERADTLALTEHAVLQDTLRECPHLDKLLSPFLYEAEIRQLLLSMKEQVDSRQLQFFAQSMERVLYAQDLGADCIVCVPTTKAKLRKRGFNHAEELAKALSVRCQLPLYPHALYSAGAARSQHTLNRTQRKANTSHLLPNQKCDLKGRRVLLVDDICTTGSTLDACAAALKQLGAASVVGLTAAITPLHPMEEIATQ